IVATAFGKRTEAQNGWYLEAAPDETTMSKEGRPAMLSISFRERDEQTDNWLITPEEVVESGTMLTWTAKSIHHAFPESYDLLVSDNGSTDPADFRLLTSIKGEGNMFARHAIDLGPIPELVGKKVRIAIAHRTNQGFMLAISQIGIETPSAPEVWCSKVDRHYFGAEDSEPCLTFTLHNYGADAEITDFRLTTPEGEIPGESFSIGRGGEHAAVISLPGLKVGDAYFYDLQAKVNGEETTLYQNFLNRSHFKRTMLLEKYTGVWCNSCPKVVFQAERAMGLLGDELIYVEPHTINDVLDADAYCENVPYSVRGDFPALWFNRFRQHPAYMPANLSAYNEAVLAPCKASVKIIDGNVEDGVITVRAKYMFAEDIDNTSGLVRPGFTVIENHVPYTKGGTQANGVAGGLYFGEYHFLPSPIDKHFMMNDGVVRESATGSCGEAGYFPDVIEAGKEYEVTHSMSVPKNIYDVSNCEVVATIVDGTTKTYEVMNADKRSFSGLAGINDFYSGAEAAAASEPVSIAAGGASITLTWVTPVPFHANAYTTQGLLIGSDSGYGTTASINADGIINGPILITLITGDKARTFKAIL
ncbi:MAG: choice-of-anchor J domain-containing protein, partial [Muribaculaceae bacterium]|nr:choice-of-anchor J domain-containing protein [Muribaculaceae bacterium]